MESFIRMYKIPIILGIGSVVLIVISLVLLVKSVQTTTPIQFSDEKIASISSTLMADVEGAVARPGVYTLPVGSRVEDAIWAAGGLTADADTEKFSQTINRATKLVDGGKLYVPKIEENKTSHNLSPLLQRPAGSSQNGGVVSVNLASMSELDALPGVGPVTAQKIIDNRPYQTLDELVAKKAIGPSLYEKLKNSLSL